MTIPRPAVWAILGSLGVLTIVALPDLGAGAWPFSPTEVDPRGVLGPLVRAADEEWDPDVPRTAAMIAALIVALAGAVVWRADRLRRGWAVALCAVVVALLVVPAALLQVGLRDATAPWYHVNDSTYQIDIAGDLVLDGDNPSTTTGYSCCSPHSRCSRPRCSSPPRSSGGSWQAQRWRQTRL